MGWQDDPVIEESQQQAQQQPQQSGNWQDDPVVEDISEDRKLYLRRKYVAPLIHPAAITRHKAATFAAKEVTDPQEKEWITEQVGHWAGVLEQAQQSEYAKKGFARRFVENIGKAGKSIGEGYTGLGEAAGELATDIAGKGKTPEQVVFTRTLEAARATGEPSADVAPGWAGAGARAIGSMIPIVQAGAYTSEAAGAGAALAGAGARTAGAASAVGAAAPLLPSMYRETYGSLLDKGVSSKTARWTAATSAGLQGALYSQLPKGLFGKLGGEKVVGKTLTDALVKNYAKAVLVHGAGIMAGASAIDSTAQEMAEWAEGKGVPDVGAILKNAGTAYAEAIGPMAVFAAPRAMGEVGAIKNERLLRAQNEIIRAADSGRQISRKQMRVWGLPVGPESKRVERKATVTELADMIKAQRGEAPPELIQQPAEEGAPTEPQSQPTETTVEQTPFPADIASQVTTAEPTREIVPPVIAPETTAIKNAAVDQLREQRGQEPIPPAERESVADWIAEAKQRIQDDPGLPDRLVKELQKQPRNLSDVENEVLGVRYRNLNDVYAKVADKLVSLDADPNADPTTKAQAQTDAELVFNDLNNMEGAVRAAGREWGRAGVARQTELLSDLTPATIVRRARVAKGEPLSPEEGVKVQQLAGRVAELQVKLDEALATKDVRQSEAAVDTAIKNASPKKRFTIASARKGQARANVTAAWDEFKKAIGKPGEGLAGGESGALNVDVMAAGVKLIKAYVELGAVTFTEFFADAKAYLGENAERARGTLLATWQKMKGEGEIPAPKVDPADQGSISRFAQKLTRTLVESGVVERNAVVDAVHEELKQIMPDITRRQTMDAISGYGQYKELSKDEISKQVRDVKGQLQQVAKLEDMQKGRAPSKTGIERRAPSDEERQLIQQVNEAKKRGGFVVTDPEKQLRTALDAAKTAVRNRITDLEQEIATREKIVKTRTELKPDTELEKLRARRDELRTEWEKVFPKEPPTQEQLIERTEKALDKSIAQLEGDLKAGKIGFKKKPQQLSTPELEAKRARLTELQEKRNWLRDATGEAEKRQTERYKEHLQRRLEELQMKMRTKDFIKRDVKKTVLDKQTLELQFELQDVKNEFASMEEAWKRKRASVAGKALNLIKDTINTQRELKAGADVSAVLRQGAWTVYAHPVMAARALPQMFKAAWSRGAAYEAGEELRDRPNAQLYRQAKLAITTIGGKLSTQEEAFRGGWGRHIPGIASSERAYVTFLNRIRADLFDAMVSNLMNRGTFNPERAKVIANYVNVSTGRGALGKAEIASGFLATTFFSPKYTVSRFQLLLGQPLWKGDIATRKIIAREYARSLIGMAVFYGTASYLPMLFGDDKPFIEWSPLSPEFAKIRFGKTVVDPMAGLAQTSVLMSRMILGKSKRATGEIVPVRGEDIPFNGLKSWDIAARFLRTKFAPAIGSGIDVVTGSNVVGEPVTPLSAAIESPIPLVFKDVYETMREQGIEKGAALSLLAIFGMGMQNYQNVLPEDFAKKISQHPKLLTRDKRTKEVHDYRTEVQQVIEQAKKMGISEIDMIRGLDAKLKQEGRKTESRQGARKRLRRRLAGV